MENKNNKSRVTKCENILDLVVVFWDFRNRVCENSS